MAAPPFDELESEFPQFRRGVWERDLAAMAADPEIQAELRRIDSEFRVTEMDGLE